jgi:hypothetical protein
MTHLKKAAAKERQGSRERVEKLLGGPHMS